MCCVSVKDRAGARFREGADVTADFVFRIAIAGLFVFSAVLASMLVLRI